MKLWHDNIFDYKIILCRTEFQKEFHSCIIILVSYGVTVIKTNDSSNEQFCVYLGILFARGAHKKVVWVNSGETARTCVGQAEKELNVLRLDIGTSAFH